MLDDQYIITKIQGLMPDEHHIPQGVLYARLKTAVQKDLSQILASLFKSGKIKYDKTLNDILIYIKDE